MSSTRLPRISCPHACPSERLFIIPSSSPSPAHLFAGDVGGRDVPASASNPQLTAPPSQAVTGRSVFTQGQTKRATREKGGDDMRHPGTVLRPAQAGPSPSIVVDVARCTCRKGPVTRQRPRTNNKTEVADGGVGSLSGGLPIRSAVPGGDEGSTCWASCFEKFGKKLWTLVQSCQRGP